MKYKLPQKINWFACRPAPRNGPNVSSAVSCIHGTVYLQGRSSAVDLI